MSRFLCDSVQPSLQGAAGARQTGEVSAWSRVLREEGAGHEAERTWRGQTGEAAQPQPLCEAWQPGHLPLAQPPCGAP